MSIQIIQELLEDADILGYIKAGADHAEYDKAAIKIHEKLSADLSVAQIERIVWEAFYYDFLVCTVGNSNEFWSVGKNQARYILGPPDRFAGIAKNIRWIMFKL